MKLRRFWNRLRDRMQRTRRARDLDDELRFHQTMLEREAPAGGPDAHHAARRRLGNRTLIREEVRSMWSFTWLEDLADDLRFGFRSLRRSPAFAAVAALTLALGIGADTAIFTVVHGVLFSPFPYAEPSRLMLLNETMKDLPKIFVSYPNFLDWRHRATAFDGIALYDGFGSFNLTGVGEAERVRGGLASGNLFDVLGVRAAAGRTFSAEEDRPGAGRVAVVTDAFWRRRLGADPSLGGKTLMLDGYSYMVIGVLPPDVRLAGAEVWIPIGLFADAPEYAARDNHPGTIGIGRLKPGVTLEQGRADLERVAAGLRADYPAPNAGVGASGTWLIESVTRSIRPLLLMLSGAVTFVLLIACANVANLLLGRAASREREMALRAALGARRGRIIRQLLAESVLLAMVGGVLGVGLAWAGVRLLLVLKPGSLPRLQNIHVDAVVLLFALVIAVVTGIAFGLVPALHAAGKQLLASLKEGGRSSSPGRSGLRVRSGLMIAEVALALVLLVGAGLLIRSFQKLSSVDSGFDPRNVLTALVQLPDRSYPAAEQRRVAFARLLEQAEALPGVTSAALSTDLPLNTSAQDGVTFEDLPPVALGSEPLLNATQVSPRWFETMGIKQIAGRGFSTADVAGGVVVAVVSEAVAKRFFPKESAVGHRFKVGRAPSKLPWMMIIGVVADVHDEGLGYSSRGTFYTLAAQNNPGSLWIALRTSSAPDQVTAPLRAALKSIDADVPLAFVQTMDELIDSALAPPRFAMLMLLIFASIALVLAAVGIYGVIAYAVAQRTHEIGVRIALGAQRTSVVGMVVRQVLVLAGIGIVIGVGGALAVGGVLGKLLFGVKPTDLPTLIAVVLLLVSVALVAAALPAWRAARLNPVSALRHE